VPQGGLISHVLFSLYVNDMPSHLHHVESGPYADDTAIMATSRKLSEWRIAINVFKSTTIIFARAGRSFIQHRPVTLFGKPIEWVDRTRYLGVTLDTRLTWSPNIDQVRNRTAQRMGMLGPLLNRKSDFSVRKSPAI